MHHVILNKTRAKFVPGLEQDQDIQSAVQNRDCKIETNHIDYTTYISSLTEMEDYDGNLNIN